MRARPHRVYYRVADRPPDFVMLGIVLASSEAVAKRRALQGKFLWRSSNPLSDAGMTLDTLRLLALAAPEPESEPGPAERPAHPVSDGPQPDPDAPPEADAA